MKNMKLFLSILLFFSTQVLACSDVKLAGMTEEQKFLMAVKNSDFVYFGRILRANARTSRGYESRTGGWLALIWPWNCLTN